MPYLSQALQSNPNSTPHNILWDGLIFFKGRLMLPNSSVLIPSLLAEYHDTITGIIWDDISLDFITELPCSQGYEVILVVVDRLSKYAHFIALKHLYTARMVAEAFIKNVTKLHRFLKSIISDKDTFFSVIIVATMLMDRDEALRQLKFHLHRALQTMKKYVDAHRRIIPKLSPRYYGPFQVLSRVEEVTYKLQFSDSARIHPVFHVSQLKRSVKSGSTTTTLPRRLAVAEYKPPSLEASLATQVNKHQGNLVEEWLILWKS
ncbi:uncharacterized protein [Glycine max]|uniref:uncharacterized protein n=1 Tax=Glycine max TaxID=3847 RepID=UPI000E21B59E|nr:uncharacterized protein LOC112999392 [Glycine max]|eukprot:XP_025981330.1 uncharacterized protein LOC112999392 [Glycine max]